MGSIEMLIFIGALAGVLAIGVRLVLNPQGEIAASEARIARDGESLFENNHPSTVAMRTPRSYRLSGVFLIAAAITLFLLLNPWFSAL